MSTGVSLIPLPDRSTVLSSLPMAAGVFPRARPEGGA